MIYYFLGNFYINLMQRCKTNNYNSASQELNEYFVYEDTNVKIYELIKKYNIIVSPYKITWCDGKFNNCYGLCDSLCKRARKI